jgi:AraC-like DNA-binding protein
VLKLIAMRFREPHLTLSELAATLGLSQPHLSRAIHRETGQPFCTHLNGFRLLAAIVTLRATSLSIKEIAAAVGYTRTSELDRQCHRVLHMTPNQIRHAVHGHVPEPTRLPRRVQAAVGTWRTQPAEIADALDIDLGFVLRLRGMSSRLVGTKS